MPSLNGFAPPLHPCLHGVRHLSTSTMQDIPTAANETPRLIFETPLQFLLLGAWRLA